MTTKTPTFMVVTDDATYVHGRVVNHFAELGHESARLEAYSDAGDYVLLTCTGGLELAIPECRIKYIADVSRAPATRENTA